MVQKLPKTAPSLPDMTQDLPKTAPRCPKISSRWTNISLRCSKISPRWVEISTKKCRRIAAKPHFTKSYYLQHFSEVTPLQEGIQIWDRLLAPDHFKSLQNRPKMLPHGSQSCLEVPRIAHERPRGDFPESKEPRGGNSPKTRNIYILIVSI